MKIHLTAPLWQDEHYVVDVVEIDGDPKKRPTAAQLAVLIKQHRDALDAFAHHLRRELAKLDKKQAQDDVAKVEASRQ